jgi:hypothetical protein
VYEESSMTTDKQVSHYLELAGFLRANEKFHAAHEVLIEAHKRNQSDPAILYHLGEVALLGEMFGLAEIHFQQAGQILASDGDIELPSEQIWLTPQLMNDRQASCQTREASQNEISHGATQQQIQARYDKFKRQTIQKLPSFLISSPPIERYRLVPQKIADGLSIEFSNNSAYLIFPGDILHPKNLLQYHHGNRIFFSYIEASDVNLRTISDCFVSQITVLISDIRCLVVDFTRQLTIES